MLTTPPVFSPSSFWQSLTLPCRALTLGCVSMLAACPMPADGSTPMADGGSAEPDPAPVGEPDPQPDGQPDPAPDAEPDAQPDPDGLFADAGPPPDNITYEPGALGGVCASSDDCDDGLRCATAFGDPFCTLNCTSDDQCDPGDGTVWACRAIGTNRLCVPHCLDERWCAEDAICAANIETPDGVFDLCVDFTASHCDREADCQLPNVCALVGAGYDVTTHCTTSAAGLLLGREDCNPNLTVGRPCSVNATCPGGTFCNQRGTCQVFQTLVCATAPCWPNGECGAACTANDDCGNGYRCRRVVVNSTQGTPDRGDDRFTFLNTCAPWEGSEDPCDADADCQGGELCSYRRAPEGVLDTVCREPDNGAVAAGARCGDDPRTTDVHEPTAPCDSNVCDADGLCAHVCTESSECGDLAEWQCATDPTTAFWGTTSGICVFGKPCSTNADCEGDDVCGLAGAEGGAVKRCEPPWGGLDVGESCDAGRRLLPGTPCGADADCDDGDVCDVGTWLCAPAGTERCARRGCPEGGRCSALCTVNDDCGGGDMVCRGEEHSLFDNFTGDPRDDAIELVAACRYLPGSRANCTVEADCTAPDESCRLGIAAGGEEHRVCTSLDLNGGLSGEPCGVLEAGVVQCRSGLCLPDDDNDPLTGVCAILCETDDHCNSTQACEPVAWGVRRDRVARACVDD